MKILLLGGAGFIGSNLAAALVEAGHEVGVLSRAKPTNPVPAIDYFVDGLEHPRVLDELLPAYSHVFHLASATTPGSSRLAPGNEMAGNLAPLACLIESLQRAAHVHLVFVSSGGAVYGNQSARRVAEPTLVSPISYYGAGKVAAEAFLRAYHAQTDHGVTVLRPSNLYGPGQRAKASFGIVPTLFECAHRRRPFELWGDGEIVRDYLYVGDFVGLCVRSIAWSAGRREYAIFNVGSGEGHSINELCDEVGAISGTRVEVIRRPPRGVDVRRIVLDPTAARQAMDWQPDTPLRQGLQLTWNWFNNQSWD